MNKPRILYDLSVGLPAAGMSGIPQETRLLFDAFSQSSKLELSGWIRPLGRSNYTIKGLHGINEQAEFLGPFLSDKLDQRDIIAKLFDKFRCHRLAQAWQLYIQGLSLGRKLYPVHPIFGDLIWRRIFASTIDSSRKDTLINRPYFLSKIGTDRNALAALHLALPPKVDTSGFEFVFTQDIRLMRVSPGTRKIARYHDGIPVTAPDTIAAAPRQTTTHINAIRDAGKDTVFVCSSTSSREDLSNISEEAAENSVVIPIVIPKMERVDVSREALLMIARSRISQSTLEQRNYDKAISKWFGKGKEIPSFIMDVASIEPRKNYLRLIQAWQMLRMSGYHDLKLMIVGSPGWDYDNILRGMRPYIERGELLHLENVAQTELPILYSAAAAFCSPSLGEGFGLPPTEAMQCGCPAVISDIPAHRYMAKNAALYCDPYNVTDIARNVQNILDNEALRNRLAAKGLKNVKRFSVKEILPVWEELLTSKCEVKSLRDALG